MRLTTSGVPGFQREVLGGARSGFLRQHGIKRGWIARRAELRGQSRVAQHAGDPRQRFQMVGSSGLGAIRRKIRSTGIPSIDSKSSGRSSRAKIPKIDAAFANLPWESQCLRRRRSNPDARAEAKHRKLPATPDQTKVRRARSDSCKACFFVLTFNEGSMALGVINSVKIIYSENPVKGDSRSGAPMGDPTPAYRRTMRKPSAFALAKSKSAFKSFAIIPILS